MNAEIIHAGDYGPVVFQLQWGRVRMNAEIARVDQPAAGQVDASMGPRSDERGNTMSYGLKDAQVKLQWGRVRMNAEMVPTSWRPA